MQILNAGNFSCRKPARSEGAYRCPEMASSASAGGGLKEELLCASARDAVQPRSIQRRNSSELPLLLRHSQPHGRRPHRRMDISHAEFPRTMVRSPVLNLSVDNTYMSSRQTPAERCPNSSRFHLPAAAGLRNRAPLIEVSARRPESELWQYGESPTTSLSALRCRKSQ